MNLLEAITLGVVQGLTEPLPISSSGHLVLVPWLLRWRDPGLAFDAAIHLGTLVAMVAYFWRTWLHLLRHDRRLLVLLLAGSVPAGIIGLLFNSYIEEHFREPLLIAGALVVFGLGLLWADKRGEQKREQADFGWRDALTIGTAQALALFPGVSRSGITITAGLMLGYRRDAAATFSFLLATPITGAAVLWALAKLARQGLPPEERTFFLAGVLTSGVVGFAAIAFLLRYVRTHTYTPFVAYRLAVGAVVAALALLRG